MASRRVSIVLVPFSIVILFAAAWFVAGCYLSRLSTTIAISPGELVITELSSAGEDWVQFRNLANRTLDVSNLLFTDGRNEFSIPRGTELNPRETLLIAAAEDQDKITHKVDRYWDGGWGISQNGEMVLLLNADGSMVIDFAQIPALSRGQRIRSEPEGSGELVNPDGKRLVQMDHTKLNPYHLLPKVAIEELTRKAQLVVTAVAGLLVSLSTLFINYQKILETIGVKRPKPKGNKEPART